MTTARTSQLVTATLCGILILGCSTVDVRSDVDRIEIANAVFLTLPGVADLTENMDATQVLVAEYDDRSYSFQVQLEFRPGTMTMAAVTLWGGTLFSISYDGAVLRTQGLLETQDLNPEYLLADVLLTYWDPERVNEWLEGGVLEVSRNSVQRTVSRGGEAVVEISHEEEDPWVGRTHFTHLERGYALDIRTVEFAAP